MGHGARTRQRRIRRSPARQALVRRVGRACRARREHEDRREDGRELGPRRLRRACGRAGKDARGSTSRRGDFATVGGAGFGPGLVRGRLVRANGRIHSRDARRRRGRRDLAWAGAVARRGSGPRARRDIRPTLTARRVIRRPRDQPRRSRDREGAVGAGLIVAPRLQVGGPTTAKMKRGLAGYGSD